MKIGIAGIRAGRTFISNGPLLELKVNGREPGAELENLDPAEADSFEAQAVSRVPFDRLEIVQNGEVVAASLASDSVNREWRRRLRSLAVAGSRRAYGHQRRRTQAQRSSPTRAL